MFWRGSVLAMHGRAMFWRGNVPGVHAILPLGVTWWVKPGSRSRLGPRAMLAPRKPRIRYYRGFSLLLFIETRLYRACSGRGRPLPIRKFVPGCTVRRCTGEKFDDRYTVVPFKYTVPIGQLFQCRKIVTCHLLLGRASRLFRAACEAGKKRKPKTTKTMKLQPDFTWP